MLDVTNEVLAAVRKAKTEAKASMRSPVERLTVRAGAEARQALALSEADLREAGCVADLVVEAGDGRSRSTSSSLACDRHGHRLTPAALRAVLP